MTRFGGAASVGHMWVGEVRKDDADAYGPPRQRKGITGTQAAVLGGGGLAALGGRTWTDSHRLPAIAASRHDEAAARHAQSEGRKTRADENLRHQTKMRNTRKIPWLSHGKVREAENRAEAAAKEFDKTKAILSGQKAGLPADVMANRQRVMRRGGKGMVTAGAALAAAPLVARMVKPKQRETVVYAKADAEVSKTITQSRYGSHAEKGRAWRGEEKKNTPTAANIAAGSGAVGALGLTGAVAANRTKPARMADRTGELEANSVAARKLRNLRVGEATTATRQFRGAKALSDIGNDAGGGAGLKQMRRELGLSGKDYPIRLPKNGNALGANVVSHLEGKSKAARALVPEAARRVTEADEARLSHGAERAANKVARLKHVRATKTGLGVAALGGAGALAAGIKAERDRNTGWGRPRRTVS